MMIINSSITSPEDLVIGFSISGETKELVNATIDTVYVYDKKRIEVVFSFDDVLMKAIEKYQKGVKEA